MENFQYLTELLKRLLPPQADAPATPLATGAQMGLEEMAHIPQNYYPEEYKEYKPITPNLPLPIPMPTFPAQSRDDALTSMARAPYNPARRPTELEDALLRLLTGAQASEAEMGRRPDIRSMTGAQMSDVERRRMGPQ